MNPVTRRVKPLPMKVLYTVTELADSLGVSRHMVRRLVRSEGIVVYQVGRTTLVPLSEIQEKLEPVWHAILAVENARARAARDGDDFRQRSALHGKERRLEPLR